MTVDFTKLPFNAVTNPSAHTLTEAITSPPVTNGFVVATLKTDNVSAAVPHVRSFVQCLRANAPETGLVDIRVYRELHRSEMGGAVPFDQSFCERMLADISTRRDTQVERFPGLASADAFALSNTVADLVLFATFEMTAQAIDAANTWQEGTSAFSSLAQHTQAFTIGAFSQYAAVRARVARSRRYFSSSTSSPVLATGTLCGMPGRRSFRGTLTSPASGLPSRSRRWIRTSPCSSSTMHTPTR